MAVDEIKERLKIFRDPEFLFNEEKHEYTYRGKKMLSVTGWYPNTFVRPFDGEKWSNVKAQERGVSKEDILHGWKVLSDTSLDLGHLVHKYIEDFLNGDNPVLPEDEKTRKRVEAWLIFYHEKLSKMQLVGQEIRVWSKNFGLAGTIDALFYYKDTLVIGDWKTNKKFKDDNDKHWAQLLYPFEDLKENTLNKYSLQVSTYMAILRDNGFDPKHAFICWISPDAEIRMYPAKDVSVAISAYLNAFPVK